MKHSNYIGNKISQARKSLGISQAELARRISISPQAVGKWERGESMPDIITLNRLAKIFNIELNYFSENLKDKAIQTKEEIEGKNKLSKQQMNRNWNMSKGNWENADFSGLKNLQEKFSDSNIENCKFSGSDLSELLLKGNNIIYCDFSNANFTGTEFRNSNFGKNIVEKSTWKATSFINTSIADVTFDGSLEDCVFDNCSFSKVTFKGVILKNTFFKCKSLKNIKFIDCFTDQISYAFLKIGKADIKDLTIIPKNYTADKNAQDDNVD